MENKKINEILDVYKNTPVYYDVNENRIEKTMLEKVASVATPNGSAERTAVVFARKKLELACEIGQIKPEEKVEAEKILSDIIGQRNRTINLLGRSYNILAQKLKEAYKAMCDKQDNVKSVLKIINSIKPSDLRKSRLFFVELCESFAKHYQEKGIVAIVEEAIALKERELDDLIRKEEEKARALEEKRQKKEEKRRGNLNPVDEVEETTDVDRERG